MLKSIASSWTLRKLGCHMSQMKLSALISPADEAYAVSDVLVRTFRGHTSDKELVQQWKFFLLAWFSAFLLPFPIKRKFLGSFKSPFPIRILFSLSLSFYFLKFSWDSVCLCSYKQHKMKQFISANYSLSFIDPSLSLYHGQVQVYMLDS